MPNFLEYRNLLMDQHGWDRRVATIAVRLYKGIDTPELLATSNAGEWGGLLLTQAEYHEIIKWR